MFQTESGPIYSVGGATRWKTRQKRECSRLLRKTVALSSNVSLKNLRLHGFKEGWTFFMDGLITKTRSSKRGSYY